MKLTPRNRLRWDLCQNLVRYMAVKGLSQVGLAKLLGIDEARVSEIVNERIDHVSTDKLIEYNEIIFHKIQLKITGGRHDYRRRP